MRCRVLTFVLSLLIAGSASAQSDSSEVPARSHLAPNGGVNFQRHMYWEAGLQWAHLEDGGPCTTPVYTAYKAGIEYMDAPAGRIIAPKLGASAEFYFLAFRGSFAGYSQGTRFDPRAILEVGLSLPLCLMQFTYGWNIPLSTHAIDEVTPHRFGIAINLDRKILGP